MSETSVNGQQTSTRTPEQVSLFWFGRLQMESGVQPEKISAWFKKDPDFDAQLRRDFGPTLQSATRGKLSAWEEEPRNLVSLIVVLDQFSRNLHRQSPKSFAQDALARSLTQKLLTREQLPMLHDAERYFALMPLMHSEALEDHREGLARFKAAVSAANAAMKPLLESATDYMLRHTRIIERFGRYPHRNAILGRENSAEEQAFLEEPGSSF